MSSTWKKNAGMHTSQDDAERNILSLLSRVPHAMPSVLGYAAFPDYKFKRPQGAAFSAAKILSAMCDKKLIRRERVGFSIAQAGREHLASATAAQVAASD